MAEQHVIIQGLPLLKWRGLDPPPYTRCTFKMTHNQASREYSRINGEGHDFTGTASIPMTFQLWFINGLEGRANLFPELWDKWFDAMADGSPAELIHPLIGPVDARVTDFSADVDSKTTAGVICNVSFIQTVLDPTKERKLLRPSVSIGELAELFAEEVGDLDIFPDGESQLDLLDAVGQLEGAAFSVTNTIDGAINKVQGLCDKGISLLEGANEHIHYASIGMLEQIWMAADDVAKNHGVLLDRTIADAIADADTSFARLAAERNNTVAELMGLNELLMAEPTIPAGSPIKYFP